MKETYYLVAFARLEAVVVEKQDITLLLADGTKSIVPTLVIDSDRDLNKY